VDSYCTLGNLWQLFETFSCVNPGTSASSCSAEIEGQVVEVCPDVCWIDECVECFPGTEQECGVSDVGVCEFGIEECIAGYWGSCVGAVFPVGEVCDGLDNDCNGEVDDGIVCCEDECTENICVNEDEYMACEDFDGDGCLEYSNPGQCGYGKYCLGGYCFSS